MISFKSFKFYSSSDKYYQIVTMERVVFEIMCAIHGFERYDLNEFDNVIEISDSEDNDDISRSDVSEVNDPTYGGLLTSPNSPTSNSMDHSSAHVMELPTFYYPPQMENDDDVGMESTVSLRSPQSPENDHGYQGDTSDDEDHDDIADNDDNHDDDPSDDENNGDIVDEIMEGQTSKCCICMVNQPTVIFLGCEHLVMCERCLKTMIRVKRTSGQSVKCPYCRGVSGFVVGKIPEGIKG